MDLQRIKTVYLNELDGNTLEWYASEVLIPIRAYQSNKDSRFLPVRDGTRWHAALWVQQVHAHGSSPRQVVGSAKRLQCSWVLVQFWSIPGRRQLQTPGFTLNSMM